MMRVRIGEFVAAVCVVAWGVARVWAAPWCDRCEVERETAAWVHWYNTRRPHLALGGITPQQAENQHTTTRKAA